MIPKLSRPLAVIDLETTGLDTDADRIVELAILEVDARGKRMQHRWLVNPGVPIPREATETHGISDRDVKGQPKFRVIAQKVAGILRGRDVMGFNIERFDLPLLLREFERARYPFSLRGRKVIDALAICLVERSRKLEEAVQFYCDRVHEGAHGAVADTVACWDLLQAQLRRYPHLPRTVGDLHEVLRPGGPLFLDSGRRFRWEAERAVFTFGKYVGLAVSKVAEHHSSYLEWMVGQDFAHDTLSIVKAALRGKYPKRKRMR
jgi:DNA polymerase-3 subunit epsilon